MARPSAAAIAAALRAEGLRVVETPGWASRGYDTLDPVAQLNHHTAGGRTPTDQRDVDECIHGRPDLPGPICNELVGKDGTIYLIAHGRARHAGPGSRVVLDELLRDIAPPGDARDRDLADDVDGNRRLWGREVDHPGDTSPLPAAQRDALIRSNAVFARLHGWTGNRSIHHRTWTARKPDMSWRGDLPALVTAHLAQENDMPLSTDDKRAITDIVAGEVNRAIRETQRLYVLTDGDLEHIKRELAEDNAAAAVRELSDEQLARIAKAVNDEHARRAAS